MTDDGLLRDELASPTIVSSERVFHGAIWDIRAETFEYGGETLRREFMDHTGAVAVLALNDADEVALIKQYRHPIRTRDWEIPAGLLDVDGESGLVAAQRELAEEADLQAERWDLLAEFFSSPGGSNEPLRVYLARGLSPANSDFVREGEEADMELRWVSLDEVVDAILARRVQNPSLTIGALAAFTARSRGWSGLGDADEPWLRHPRNRNA